MLRLLRPLAVLVMVLVGLLTWAPPAADAHDPGSTLVTVATASSGNATSLKLTAQIPLSRIDFAYHTQLDSEPAQTVPAARDWLAQMVQSRVELSTPDDGSWSVVVDSVVADELQGFNTAHLELTATPPAGTAPSLADLRWEAVTDTVYSHKVFVAGTTDSGAAELSGLLTHRQPVLQLQVVAPPAQQVSFSSMLEVGFGHFREGADHLLFLAMVALATARRRARPVATLRRLAVLTAMFTVGHSASLALAALGWVILPSQWVETGIAVTIVLAAVHAVRPTLPGLAELSITAGFGLIHGFGFAGTLQNLTLTGADLVGPLVGFNLGLEAAQLLALGLLTAPLWVLARSTVAASMLAAGVAVIAGCWVLERAFQFTDPLQPLTATLLATPERLAAVLVVAALLVLALHRLRTSSSAAP